LGVKDFWGITGSRMSAKPSAAVVVSMLKTITDRRNQIVHEADLVRKTKAKEITLRDLNDERARLWISWIRDFVQAMDAVVSATV
jgi:hypothetical protein